MNVALRLIVMCLLLWACTPGGSAQDPSNESAEPFDTSSATGAPEPPADRESPAGADPVRRTRAGWSLREVTADGTHVALRVSHGACDGYVGPVVTEDSSDQVEILVAYEPPAGVTECEDILLVELEVVELPTPLEDRDLRGCGPRVECQVPASDDEYGRNGGIAATAGVVVATVDDGIVGLDSVNGQELWRLAHRPDDGRFLEQPTAFGDVVLLVDQGAANDVIAVDSTTGEVRWEASGRVPFTVDLSSQVGPDQELVLLTPRGGLADSPQGLTGGTMEARRPDGTVAWSIPVEGQVFQTTIVEETAIVLSGRNQDGQQLGRTVVTALDLPSGTPQWRVDLPGQPFGMVARALEDILVVDVLGATYGLRLSDGGQVWRNLPLNYGGIVDVGAAVMLSPGRFGDPYLLLDPLTGDQVGLVAESDELRDLDVRRYARVGGDIVIGSEGVLERRDVLDTPLTEPDASPAWTTDLFAVTGPSTLSGDDMVVVPTPLGARALDAGTGELAWAFADLSP